MSKVTTAGRTVRAALAAATFAASCLVAPFAAPLGGAGEANARPLTPAERRHIPYTGAMPVCQDQHILQRIARHFHQAEVEYWSSGLAIVAFDKVRETGYRSNGIDYIPRRYCHASALMNDGKARQVVYSVGEKLGMIGWGAGVEWCIVGLDRNYAWGRACKAAMP